MSEIIETAVHVYRGITYMINRWELNVSGFMYGYELTTKDTHIFEFTKLLEPLGYDLDYILDDDAQHIENDGQTDIQRVAYLHKQAKKDIDNIWNIYDNLFDIMSERILKITLNASRFKEIMEMIK
jgi:hypothetical protein